MSLHDDSGHTRPRPHPQALAGPYLEFDLGREIDQLTCEPQSSDGQNAKTLVKYDDLRIVLMVLKAQARVPDHKADGERSDVHSTCRLVACSHSTGASHTTWRRSKTVRCCSPWRGGAATVTNRKRNGKQRES
jgi:hypothetical protein